MNISEIEGIGPAYAEKLGAAGVNTTQDLLDKGASADGRQALADTSGISQALIRDWVNHADLMRINGVGPQFAEMLEASGVDSIPELAQRNAENLATKLDAVNTEKNLANRTPSMSEVERWIEEAKTLPRVVSH